ncbi:MAG: hypothetical protein H6862_03030 [Rhodospirillales bacterium]|nr:hypothetical protein [Rhodospirillales bacterium]
MRFLTPSHQSDPLVVFLLEAEMSDTTITILISGAVLLLLYWAARTGIVSFYRRIRKPAGAIEKAPVGRPSAKTSPERATQNSAATNIAFVIVFGGMLWYLFGGGLEQQAAKNLQGIKNQVAADAVAQYEIARRHGSAVDRCVQAGLVSAALLQAHDEANYRRWKAVEESDCASAGVPR